MPRSTKRKRRKRCEECNELFEGESRRCPKCKAKALDGLRDLKDQKMPDLKAWADAQEDLKFGSVTTLPPRTEVASIGVERKKPIFIKLTGGVVINLNMIEAISEEAGYLYMGGTKTYSVQPQDLKLIRELVELKEVKA